MRRVALAVAALLGATVLPTTPVAAAGYCSVSVPTKLSITKPYTTYTSKFYGSCTSGDGWGSWDLVHPTQGPQDMYWVEGGSSLYDSVQTEEFYDWETRGALKVVPAGAYDGSGNELTQNSRTMTVKLGSRNALTTSRSGSTVYLTSKVTYYSPNYQAFRNRSGATVKFYSRNSDGSWTYRTSATTNTYGLAKRSISSSTTRTWKAVMVEQSSVWGSTSGTSTR